MPFIDYTAFNPAHAHLTISNLFSLYSVPPTQRNNNDGRFSYRCACVQSKNTMFSIKIVKSI